MSEQQLEKIVKLLEEIKGLLKDSGSSISVNESSRPKRGRDHVAKDWGVYLKEKEPKNDYECVAMAVDFLGKDVSGESIINFIRENPVGFTNLDEGVLRRVIGNTAANKHYGYIEFTDKKKKKYYRLTIKGRHLINELPNRPKMNKKSKKSSAKKQREQEKETYGSQ